jgi:hypothetical protein
MEDECGRLGACRLLLWRGLQHCAGDDSLMSKAVKHEERLLCLEGARQLLSRVRGMPVDKSWRAILEGAQLEARVGRVAAARAALALILQMVPSTGPVHLEASRCVCVCVCVYVCVCVCVCVCVVCVLASVCICVCCVCAGLLVCCASL